MVRAMLNENTAEIETGTDETREMSPCCAKQKLTEAELVDNYGTAVYRFCRSITCTKEDADDLYQDTYLSVFSQMHKIENSDNPKGFLLSTAAFRWKSQRRKYARRYRLAPEVELNEDISAVAELGRVEDDILTHEERLVVRTLVDLLPDKLKIPVILHYTNEMKVAEIALTLGLPIGTVMSRLYKARSIVKKGLVSNYGYCQ